jgi:hypothetical protein
VFENVTPGGLTVHKVTQARSLSSEGQPGETRLLFAEHLVDAMAGLATAKRWLKNAERELWYDRSREILK